MSGICGIVNFDGALVNPDTLKTLAEKASYRGPDGIRYYIQGNVGLAHLALHITPESVYEQQPLIDHNSGLALVSDARIDNREELIAILSGRNYLNLQFTTDAHIILAAYKHWGMNCAEHLLGDFAFAIVDLQAWKVFAARAPRGWRTFHYHWKNSMVCFASEAAQLLSVPGVSSNLNDEEIAHDLVKPGFGSVHESYFQDIRKLAPAEAITLSASGVVNKRFWELKFGDQLHYPTEMEYIEHFFHLFQDAVRRRLRSIRPVNIFLSGGLDSTSIAAMAASEMVAQHRHLTPELKAITFISNKMPLEGELQRSQAVADFWNIPHHLTLIDDLPVLPQLSGSQALHQDEAYCTTFFAYFCKALAAQANQPAICIYGLDGDSVVGVGSPFFYLDLLQKGKVFAFLQAIREGSRRLGVSPLWLLNYLFIKPYLITPARRFLRPVRHLSRNKVSLPPWIDRGLAAKTRLEQWVLEQPDLLFVDPQQRTRNANEQARIWRHKILTDPTQARMSAHLQNLTSRFGKEACDPWGDTRLIEFALSIPQSLLSPGVNRKYILRQGLKDYLPEKVREHLALKTGPEAWVRQMFIEPTCADFIHQLSRNSMAEKRGFLIMAKLQQGYGSIQKDAHRFSFPFWTAISLEIWLRTYY